MTGEPNRLLHDPATAAVLRRDLGVASGQDVGFNVAAGLSRFESALAADLARGTGAGAGASSGGLAVGALLLAGGLAAALGWQLSGPTELEPASAPAFAAREAFEPEPMVAPTPMRVPTLAPAPAAESAALEAELIEAELAEAPRRRIRGARSETPSSKAPAAKAPADYLREARELNAARGFLGADPAQALALAEAGGASFRAGAFVQEWEGVAVLALFELGRVDEARTRGEAFLQQYPNGTYAPRIRAARDAAR
jgi:TolA-binding protein